MMESTISPVIMRSNDSCNSRNGKTMKTMPVLYQVGKVMKLSSTPATSSFSSGMFLLSITMFSLMITFVHSFPTTSTTITIVSINNTDPTRLQQGSSNGDPDSNNGSQSTSATISTGESLHRFVRQTTIMDKQAVSSKSTESSYRFEPYLQFKSSFSEETLVEENERFLLECDVSGTPNPMIYWLRNGQLIPQQQQVGDSDEQTMSLLMMNTIHQTGQLGLSRVRSRLFLECLSPELDSGAVYTCVASTPYEQKRSETRLVVRPRSTLKPLSTNIGDKEVEMFANQNSIESHHRSSNMKAPSAYHKITNLYDGSSESSSSTKSTISTDTRTTCLKEKTLNAPARIYFWTETIVENMGQDCLIHCRSTGYPRPTNKWFMDDQTQPLEGSYDGKYRVLPSGDLLIRNITFEDMGIYRCLAQNDHGSDSVEKIFLYPTLKE